jgi:hypothetical protein
MDGHVGRCQGIGLWHVSSPALDTASVAEAQKNPFTSARKFEAATNFPGQKRTVISRFKEVGLRAQHCCVRCACH